MGGAFFASDGAGNAYTGIYDPNANNFLVYGSNFNFVGQLNAGSNPATSMRSVAQTVAQKEDSATEVAN